MTHDAADTWTRVQAELRRTVDRATYDLWLAPLRLRSFDGDTLVLEAPDDRRRWVADRFARVLRSCATAVLGPGAAVDVVASSQAAAPTDDQAATVLEQRGRPELNPKLTFDQFVIGDSNRLAHAAALAVAELPGTAYNPLFVYGPPGVGKTHLLQSIANYLVAYEPSMRVRYTTAERFTNEFLAAIQTRDVERFKGSWRGNDVLLIDDVQFLESKAKTEEEFFHTFNALYDAGAQLVLSSDSPPRDLAALEDRLRERFEAGLVTDIAAPSHAMRVAILRKRAHHDGIDLPDDAVLDAIAGRMLDNVRALEGALIRVVAYASLTRRPLDAALADEVLSNLYPSAPRPGTRPPAPTIERIQDAVCEHFGLTREELLSTSRATRVAWPRQLAMFLAREHTQASLPSIGAAFGGRNHTTVLHAVKRTEQRMAADRDAYDAAHAVIATLRADGRD
ncbi:MAG TPA: chromosomal replication initiator protein DnaA [Solirubrobacteraceae bacterium]|nr:chromosomal replication initiator protein DnaA [Solirubrobacteraceae bacterium]